VIDITPRHVVSVDPSVYKPASQRAWGGKPTCNHDWIRAEEDDRGRIGVWHCSACGRVLEYERWI
jgi:hypothetical protein